MNPEFWHERWKKNDIGFHQDTINTPLQEFWQKLGLESGQRVFVPFCGKSRDILWIQSQGNPVVGVEISPLAIESFFKENHLQAVRVTEDKLIRWKCSSLEILCCDFFNLHKSHLEGVAAVYDRASLVALPPEMRVRYIRHLISLLPQGLSILLLTLDYNQKGMEGPPFSVSDEEVKELFEADFKIEKLQQQGVLDDFPRFKERGLAALTENVYRLRSKKEN